MRKQDRLWVPEAPQLMLNRTVEVEVPTQHVAVEGLIGWQLIRRGKVIRESRPQPNLVVDAGLNFIGSTTGVTGRYAQLINRCGVGTSNTPPAVDQTSLGAQLGSRIFNTGGFFTPNAVGPSNAYIEMTVNRLFTEAQANGNLTEVGFFDQDTGGSMFNRQLFKDDLGADTVITKTSEDQLRVILKWRFYYQTVTFNQPAFDISGSSYSVDTRVVSVTTQVPDDFGWWDLTAIAYESNTLPAITATLTGTNAAASSKTLQAYTAGSFYRDFEAKWEPGVANFGSGIGGVAWSPRGTGFASVFTPKIPKNNTQRVALMLRTTFGRYVP